MGTFSGVFVPTSLNVLSILMFLRFGMILGQTGLLAMFGLLVVCYAINLVTTFSLSAISTNGQVRSGGTYYLISRTLGPEFGGSIGLVYFLGSVLNTSLNAIGLVDCLKQNFGDKSGSWMKLFPEGYWLEYAYATVALIFCSAICFGGSGLFARASNGLLVVLLLATFSIPISALFVRPFIDHAKGIQFTGPSLSTFKGNLLPNFTKGAAGSQIRGRENYQDLFGILFPATGGIFAGASMSGDLKHPSRAIPKGTLMGLALTFVAYTVVILGMAVSITRQSFYNDVNVIQDTNLSRALVLLGEIATSLFSALMGVIGSAKLLQALARDYIVPGMGLFAQGSAKSDEPIVAIIVTYAIAQISMLADINKLASFVTMTYLMTFLVTNLACFLLKLSSAPNFRPSFHFFNIWTALAGTLISGITMFVVDNVYASSCVALLIMLFLLIHYTCPPKSWGDVSQSLIYHQVRKYLLKLRPEHVKFWRPQILLLVNDPRRNWKLVHFCNSLKKGGLFILGHVIQSSDFAATLPEARKQQTAWSKYIEYFQIKAFSNVAISPSFEWGARNIVLNAGLGGMRPNVVIIGFYNLKDYRENKPLIDLDIDTDREEAADDDDGDEVPKQSTKLRSRMRRKGSQEKKAGGALPTDTCRSEGMSSVQSYVTVLEDMLVHLQVNIAVARGFKNLEMPSDDGSGEKEFIDLWPIQMSAEIHAGQSDSTNILTTNFDTYTLILQLGAILNTVPSWRKNYKLRIAVFVEYESDVEEERGRVQGLLADLRIRAEVIVLWLACGSLKSYELIVNGKSPDEYPTVSAELDRVLKHEQWWQDIQQLRGFKDGDLSSEALTAAAAKLFEISPRRKSTASMGGQALRLQKFEGIRKLLHRQQRRKSMSGLHRLGVSLGMTTHRMHHGMAQMHEGSASASEESGTSSSTSSDELSLAETASDDEAIDLSDDETDNRRQTEAATRSDDPHADEARDLVGDMKQSRPKRPRRHSTGEEDIDESHPSHPPTHAHPPGFGLRKTHTAGSRKNQPLPTPPPGSSTPPPTITISTSEPPSRPSSISTSTTTTSAHTPPPTQSSSRASLMRRTSGTKFTSRPVPKTQIATVDGPGPSIMFAEPAPAPATEPLSSPAARAGASGLPSIYARPAASEGTVPTLASLSATLPASQSNRFLSPTAPQAPPPQQQQRLASGSPSATASALPLSFNDLPSRAQHMILNELMRAHAGSRTAVVFTTLPSPARGAGGDEEESVRYVEDLDLLCRGLPPVLLVHSNSVTVTMNL